MALGRNIRKRIETDWPLRVGRVKIANGASAITWNAVRYRLGKVAVRVDDGNSLPRHDVVHSQVEEDRALTRARLTNDVDVPFAIFA